MSVLTARIGPFFAWQLAALVIVFVGAGVGAYSVVGSDDAEDPAQLAEGEQLVVASIGDIVNSITTSGTVVFPVRESVSFDGGGDVEEVLVAEGDRVKIGQKLAVLDDATIASRAEATVDAEMKLADAAEAIEEAVAGPSSTSLAKSGDDIVKSRQALRDAQEALTDLTAVSADDLSDAEAAIVDARHDVAIKVINLDNVTKQAERDIADARDAEDEAKAAYSAEFESWLGITLSTEQTDTAPDVLLAGLGIDLEELFGLRTLVGGTGPGTLRSDDPDTAWNELVVQSWVSFYPGRVLGTCDKAPKESMVVCASQELQDAWDGVQATDLAVNKLLAADSVGKADTALSNARDALADAEQSLLDLNAPTDELDALAARAKVALTRAQLADEEAQLVELLKGTDELALRSLRAQLAVAEQALKTAREQLAGAVLVAPIAGTVSTLAMEPGDRANQQSVLVEIVDTTVVEIDGSVDEVDVLEIEVGAQTTVSMTALQGQTLVGKISEIGTADAGQSGVVTFPVTIRLDVPRGLTLREGLSATSEVVIDVYPGVLRIPTSAIGGSFIEPTIRVADGDVIEERPVELGPSDDFWVVVLAGLSEGERLVMPKPAAANTEVRRGVGGLLGGRNWRSRGSGGGGGGRGGGGGGRGGGGGGRGG